MLDQKLDADISPSKVPFGKPRSLGNLNLDELRRLLLNFELIEEEPRIVDQNYIMTWEHSTKNFKKFTPKI
jgi:hypothetical protein